MEAVYKPMTWKGVPLGLKLAFKMMRAPFVGWMMVSVGNMFLKKMVPDLTVRKLSGEELRHYKAPCPTVGRRKPVRVWPHEIPFDGKPANVHRIVSGYSQWLQETQIPKLMLTSSPGVTIKVEDGPAGSRRMFPIAPRSTSAMDCTTSWRTDHMRSARPSTTGALSSVRSE